MYEPWDLSRRLNWLRSQMGDLLNTFQGNSVEPGWTSPTVYPALNIWQDGDRIYAEAEMPGLKIEDIEITVMGNELTLRGERKEDPRRENHVFHRHERSYGTFHRTFLLPVEVDASRVEAVLKNGVLTLCLPKDERAKPRKIEVKLAGPK